MLSRLAVHPFAVEAFFDYSLVITIAVRKEELEPYVPSFLDLDVMHNRWAFLAIAAVQTKSLRPKGFPKFMGRNFFLIGYRLFTRYTDKKGKTRRGLYILKSQTDSRSMLFLGSIFTKYRYEKVKVTQLLTNQELRIDSKDFSVDVKLAATDFIPPPESSPFDDWKEARKFAGPLPFTFSEADGGVLMVEGVRSNWDPRPVEVVDFRSDFLKSLGFKSAKLASAFLVSNIPYYWKKGSIA
ncbi:DUF2071 domain-containing protein [Olivibacter sp. SDN3]|uniref:DUF2071 domain-containing protein n=1 Tax=Olivibacter sp. SDN3 TaxID=2764720 RepID=UPI0016514887|nr:DUF2071 domain-containing protein [Olivibacter sp. SDN3]QNL47880.1 DUF2071 domain-containing protein [Olivibacter sp. SDN3]